MKRSLLMPLTLALALPLAACSSADTNPAQNSSTPDAPTTSPADLATTDSALGEIVVDSSGKTVYYFTADTAGSGESSCADDCLTAWPSVHPTGAQPVVEGVSADVATITGNDGEPQVTIDGRPVYTFAGDTAAGETAGQGLDGAWFAISPDGEQISTPAGDQSPAAGY